MSIKMAAETSAWLDALKPPAVRFGLVACIVIWAGIFLLIDIERNAARSSLASNTANLSRVFEENVIRSIREIDKTLLYLRQSARNDPKSANWPDLFHQSFAASEITFQLAVIDAQGQLLASDRGPYPPAPLDLSDREHFKVHVGSIIDRLDISKPVLGRVSNKWSVQLTRKLIDKTGGFAGVIVASLDPGHFSDFYKSIDLGAGGGVTVIGLDSVVRASGGQQSMALGSRLHEPALLDKLRVEENGTVLFESAVDRVRRVASFRWIRGYPLAVIVATDENQPMSTWQRDAGFYVVSGIIMTLLIGGAVAAGVHRSLRLAEARRELDVKSRELQLTLDNIEQGVLMVDAGGRIGFLSERCAELLGLPSDFAKWVRNYDALVAHLEKVGDFHSDLDPAVRNFMSCPGESNFIAAYERERPDGTVLEIRTKLLDGGGFVRAISDVTKRRRAEAKIMHLARHDVLTGLCNRGMFRQKLQEATRRLDEGLVFAVHMIDLDRFKSINDTHGHLVGDKLLQAVAQRLTSCVRSSDIVARLGGDEFAAIQVGARTCEEGAALAERICRVLSQPYVIEGSTLIVGATVGIAFAPEAARTPEDLLHAADLALYSAKAASRGTIAMFNKDMHAQYSARQNLEADLRQAIAEDQFELHYQPILSIASGEVTAYEALIRWTHPARGRIAPLEFIPLAEETGLIGAIGAWVLKTACREVAGRSGSARVAINMSPVQFRSPEAVDIVKAAIAEANLPPHRLEIEITEGVFLQNDQLTQQHLAALRDLGVHITMDDFGTGYSSLSYLLTYPIQTIKIDRAFVAGLGTSESSSAIIKTIVALANSLGMSTTAEGVETEHQLRLLRNLGCSDAQGYLLSRPMPADAILPPRHLDQLRGPHVTDLRAAS